MTSEEFAKWFVRPGGTFPRNVIIDDAAVTLINRISTLAEDYLALLQKQRSTERLRVENYKAVTEVREILELPETVSLSYGTRGRMSELRTLREQMKDVKTPPAPAEYHEEKISFELHDWLRELGVRPDVVPSFSNLPQGGVWIRWPKAPK